MEMYSSIFDWSLFPFHFNRLAPQRYFAILQVLLGIQIAASILIGHKLGAQDKLGALTMARLVIIILG